jgi:hypothetical protein
MNQQLLDLDGSQDDKRARYERAKAFTKTMRPLGEGNDYGRYTAWQHGEFVVRLYHVRHTSQVKYELIKDGEVVDYKYGSTTALEAIEHFCKTMGVEL